MTRTETMKIVAFFRELYPNGPVITEATINAWHTLLSPYDYKSMWQCAQLVAREWDGYTMPPPATLLKKLEAVTATGETPIDLWNRLEKMLSNGAYGSVEEFEKAPPIIQRYLGSPSRIRYLSMVPMDQLEFERARFLKEIAHIREDELQRAKLTQAETREFLDELQGYRLIESGNEAPGKR